MGVRIISNMFILRTRPIRIPAYKSNRSYSPGIPGSGAGKGGGAGGTIKESGGSLGRYGAAQEESYFYNKEREQIEKLKKKLKTSEPEQKHESEPPKE